MVEGDRNLKRRHLVYYLEIYDDDSGNLLGHLVDLTTKGIKLISKDVIEDGKNFNLRMMLPEGYFEERMIHFTGNSLWCKKDINPDFHVTGFEVAELDQEVKRIMVKLINWLGFNDNTDEELVI